MLLVIPHILSGQPGFTYEAVRLNDEQPIITQEMFSTAGVTGDGENINGPSLIRVPDWIPPEERADPDAQYYIYFAHHDGPYIRMAWAKDPEGPWHLYSTGSNVPAGQRGVLDQGGKPVYLDNGIMIEYNHVASPDAFVDNENQRIILYFHCGSSTFVDGEELKKQVTYVSTSGNGLNFYDQIEPVFLGPSYFRVFEYNEELYALTNDGTPYRATNYSAPWTPPQDHNFKQYLWEKHPENPFQLDINNDGYTKDELRVRHTAVRKVGEQLHVFYSRRGELQERIQLSTIDLSVGSWENWDATYPPIEILRPEPGWEGGELPEKPSETSAAPENVNQLRDPFVFEDKDGSLYLLYTGRGEDAIGIAALYYLENYLAGVDLTDLEGTNIKTSNENEPWISETEGAGSPPGEGKEQLIDNDNLTKYTVRASSSWIEILPPRYSTVTGYTVTFATDHPARDPNIWEFLGWDDMEQEWISLHAFINYPVREQKYLKQSWLLDSDVSFSKYKLDIKSINGDPNEIMQLAELQVFGNPGDTIETEYTDTTGIRIQKHDEFLVYPNPGNGIVHIFNPTGVKFNCAIYSMNGKMIMEEQNMTGETTVLDLQEVPGGIYILHFRTEKTTSTRKIMIHQP